MGRPGEVVWNAEQDREIRERYPALGAKRLAEEMRVPVVSLMNRANYLGVYKDKDFHWTPETEQLVAERYQTDGAKVLAEELGTTAMSVTAKARRLGIGSTRKTPPKDFEWTEVMLAAIRERYEAEGAGKLAEEFGVRRMTVYRKATDLGLHTIAGRAIAGRVRAESNAKLDIHYFDQWSPNMAYILGFLFADGCVQSDLGSVSVVVSAKDVAVLEFIRKELKSEHTIYKVEGKQHSGPLQGNQRNHRAIRSLSLGSTVLVESLVKRGMHPRKTYRDDQFPEVPDDAMPHFIRGHFDGDGCASVPKVKTHCSVSFVGSEKFIRAEHAALVRLVGMSERKIHVRSGKTTAYAESVWSSQDDLQKFINYIYPPGYGFCLERKKKVLDDWLAADHKPLGWFHGTGVHTKEELEAWMPWTEEQRQFLLDHYKELGPLETSRRIGRTRDSVQTQATKMGLTRKNKRRQDGTD